MSFLFRIHIAVLIPFLFIASALEAQDDSMLGFSAESAVFQRQLEASLDEQIDRDNLQKWMERITAKPFFVGSPHNKENAEFVKKLFQESVLIKQYLDLFLA